MLHPEPEESVVKPLTGETIFEHIRRKAKNYPVFDELKSVKSEYCTLTDELFSENQHTFSVSDFDMFEKAHSDQILQDRVIILDSEPMTTRKDTILTKVKHDGAYEEVNSPSKVPRIDLKSFKIPSPNNSLVKKELQCPRSSIRTNGKQLYSPVLSKTQSCSSQTAGEIREADSFLGFKSVFSFL